MSKCGRKMGANSVACCAPEVLAKDRTFICCKHPKIEIVDDYILIPSPDINVLIF
ncbi:MAG: hypothetical protein V3R82_06890 [Candidatus Hydrothermarchaeales archaeon]